MARPPLLPSWDGYPLVATLRERLEVPVILENDVNLRALGETRSRPPEQGPVVYVKVGTGIGAGIVNADGTILRGADGAAGDIGHLRVIDSDALCSCGGRGCLEAVASAGAVGRALGVRDEDLG
ncbi:hypothetical protein GCM10010489_37940 [Microbacterium saperdae]|nr:hypothetical protein GCM10010489_37940 [Microbacterium saperdae]